MVNIVDLNKADVLHALEAAAGCKFAPADKRWPGVYAGIAKAELIILDMRPDDGLEEFWFDRVLGAGAAQRAVDQLRMEAKTE